MKVYLSVPLSIPWHEVQPFIKLIEETGAECTYYKRNTDYNEDIIEEADALVIFNKNFNNNILSMSRGCAKEVHVALKNMIPIFVAWNSSTGPKIYSTIEEKAVVRGITQCVLAGVSGSYTNLQRLVDEHTKNIIEVLEATIPKEQPKAGGTKGIEVKKDTSKDNIVFDRRLLFLIK